MSLKQTSVLLSRISLFVIYFWFGILKIFSLSPASPLVQELFKTTIAKVPLVNMVSPEFFVVTFGIFEVIIGILFLIPGREKLVMKFFVAHMLMTFLPLLLLYKITWKKFLIPTLEGQYIIKNLALIACALNILSIVPKELKIEENIKII